MSIDMYDRLMMTPHDFMPNFRYINQYMGIIGNLIKTIPAPNNEGVGDLFSKLQDHLISGFSCKGAIVDFPSDQVIPPECYLYQNDGIFRLYSEFKDRAPRGSDQRDIGNRVYQVHNGLRDQIKDIEIRKILVPRDSGKAVKFSMGARYNKKLYKLVEELEAFLREQIAYNKKIQELTKETRKIVEEYSSLAELLQAVPSLGPFVDEKVTTPDQEIKKLWGI